jgi:hypothetical protein
VAVEVGGSSGSWVATGIGLAVGVSGGRGVKVGDGATRMGVLVGVINGPATAVTVDVGSSSMGKS